MQISTRASTRRASRLRVGVVVGNETWRFFQQICTYLGRYTNLSVFDPPGGFERQNRSLRRNLRTFLKGQDIVFFEWSGQLLALATELETNCKIVTRLHRYELFTWAKTICWQRVNAVIFVNAFLQEKFRRSYWRTHPRKMIVIPEGVSTVRFRPMGLGLTYRIGTLCWITPRKRIYELILCFSELREQHPKLRLSIAGARRAAFLDYYDALLALVDKLGLSSRVELVGQPQHVPAWYRTIDLFVSNSYSEGVHVSLLEAMSSARHCLSHAWQGVETVLPPDQIYLTDRELQEKILAFYAAPRHVRERARKRMRQEVCTNYDIRIVQQEILSLLTEVAQSC